MRCKLTVPCPGCLLQSIEGLVESADELWVLRIDEARGLRAVSSCVYLYLEDWYGINS